MTDADVEEARYRVSMKRELRLAGIISPRVNTLDTFTLEILHAKVCLKKLLEVTHAAKESE